MKTFEEFFAENNGKPVEVNDPSNLNQCMDLAYAWCDALEIPRDTIRHLHAKDVYKAPNDLTVLYFELVPNTAMAIPHKGDLVVFDTGESGHISISTGKGDVNTFESFDQNWGITVGHAGLIIHSYKDVLGFLRPRKLEVQPAPEPPEIIVDPAQKIDFSNLDNNTDTHETYGILEKQEVDAKFIAKDRALATRTQIPTVPDAPANPPASSTPSPVPSVEPSSSSIFSQFLDWIKRLIKKT